MVVTPRLRRLARIAAAALFAAGLGAAHAQALAAEPVAAPAAHAHHHAPPDEGEARHGHAAAHCCFLVEPPAVGPRAAPRPARLAAPRAALASGLLPAPTPPPPRPA